MPKSVKELVEAANAVVPRVTPEQAQQMIAGGALVVDVRDAPEVEQSGKVAGAVHIPRGMLEFRADLVALLRQEFRRGQARDRVLRGGADAGL